MSGLPAPVSGGTVADLANRIDEKPGSCNRNLPGVEYALELVEESAGGLHSRPTCSAVGMSAYTSPVTDRRGNGFCRAYRLVSPMCCQAARPLRPESKDARLTFSPLPAQRLQTPDGDPDWE